MSNTKEFWTYVKSIKNKQLKQINLIQSKVEQDNGVLVNIIGYLKKRIEIEKEYNRNMEKNNKFFQAKLKKSLKLNGSNESVQSNSVDDDISYRLIYNSFNSLITESSNIISLNQKNCDTVQNNVLNILQDLSRKKEISYKKKIELLVKIKDDLFKTYTNLERTRQSYESFEKDSQNQKSKYEEACSEPKGALGTVKNMLRTGDSSQRIEKYHNKWETSQINSTNSRNEYLLYLEMINLQNTQFYNQDVPSIMKNIDDSYFEDISNIFGVMTNMRYDYSQEVVKSVNTFRESVNKINREDDNKLYTSKYKDFFTKPTDLKFMPYGKDEISTIINNENTKHQLSQQLEIFNKELTTIDQNIEKTNRELQGLDQLIQVYSDKPSFGNAADSMNQRNEIADQLEKLNNERVVYMAIVKKLTDLGVELERPTIIGTIHKKAIALYPYTSNEPGKLSMKENESIIVIEEEGNGWVKAQIGAKIGLVPENYIKLVDDNKVTSVNRSSNSISLNSSNSSIQKVNKKTTSTSKTSTSRTNSVSVNSVVALFDYAASDSTELSFKAGDVIEIVSSKAQNGKENEKIENQWWLGKISKTNKTGQFPVVFTKGWEVLNTKTKSTTKSKVIKVKALYDYEATCEGELTIKAGDIITVTNKNTGSSSWWEGKGPNGHGQFPSLYVKELNGNTSKANSVTTVKKKTNKKVRALYDYTAQNPDELSFSTNDIIELIEDDDDNEDWWMGKLKNNTGLIPKTYIEKI